MRLTFSTEYRNLLQDLTRNKESLGTYEKQVSSGKRISAPGDDPLAAASSVNEYARMGTLDSYARATDSTTSRLTVADSVLSDILTQLTYAKTQALSSRGTAVTASMRQAAANALQGVRETLVSDLNMSYQSAHLFSGAKTTTAPYSITGGTVSAYQGDANAQYVDVDAQIAIQATFDGESITRGSDPQDLFTQFDSLITAVQAGDGAGIDTAVAAIDRAFSRTTQVQTMVGTALKRLEGQSTRLTTIRQTQLSQISKLEDADLADAITKLQASQTAQEATLRAIAVINQQSLMDYLK